MSQLQFVSGEKVGMTFLRTDDQLIREVLPLIKALHLHSEIGHFHHTAKKTLEKTEDLTINPVLLMEGAKSAGWSLACITGQRGASEIDHVLCVASVQSNVCKCLRGPRMWSQKTARDPPIDILSLEIADYREDLMQDTASLKLKPTILNFVILLTRHPISRITKVL